MKGLENKNIYDLNHMVKYLMIYPSNMDKTIFPDGYILLFVCKCMFETFTIRTKPSATSTFKNDSNFSLLKMLSLDPLACLGAEEFIAWMLLTLAICLVLYTYSLVWQAITARLFTRFTIKCEVPLLNASYKQKKARSEMAQK